VDVDGWRDFGRTVRRYAARGKTVLFATHYLEEADANADRAVMMAQGRIVADGPTTEIKARIGHRTIRATLAGVDRDELTSIDGVSVAERHGDSIILRCTDSDRAIRALLERHPDARDIEITGAALEEAFLELTRDPDADRASGDLMEVAR
jgi:ABC-2 type transport system ATP-binding protein